MNRTGLFAQLALCMGFCALSVPASAVTVSLDGADYTVGVSSLGGTAYEFTFTADFAGFTNSSQQQYISGINFKIASAPDVTGVVLISAPVDKSFWNATYDDNLDGSTFGCDDENGGAGSFAQESLGHWITVLHQRPRQQIRTAPCTSGSST